MKYHDKRNPEYEEELSRMNIGEEQTPLQRRAETERKEADNAAHAARSDVKRRRARKARQVYAKQRSRKLELGEASSKEIKDLVTQYNKIKGKSAKMSGRDVILNGKKVKADDALETMAAAVMKLESVSQISTFVEYHELEEKKITKVNDIGPKSPDWKKCKLAVGIRYADRSYKKGDTVFCHPFSPTKIVVRPTMKDGNAVLSRSAIENPPPPLKEALNQRGRKVRPDGQVSKHEPGMMATRPETESPSGAMSNYYKGGRGTPAERYAAAKKKIKRLSTQNTSGQSVKTKRETDKRTDSLRKSVY